MNILFADDVEDIRILFAIALRRHGIITRTVENGKEAVAAMQEETESYDAVVLDIDMPVMDGWQALDAIRHLPKGHNVPVVMFTGNCDAATKAQALQHGANSLLCKPAKPQDLAIVLDNIAPTQAIFT